MFADSTFARKHKKTWDYPLNFYKKFEVTGSNESYQFQFDLKKDNDVLKEIHNNKETGVISYLLFENNKIVIDESDIPIHVQGDGKKIIF
jgi:hypothetical protein